jgi:hypothetical protein
MMDAPTTAAIGLARRQADDVIVLFAAMRIAAVSDRSDDGKQLGSSELLR